MLPSPHSSLLLYTMLNFGVAYRDTGYPHSEFDHLFATANPKTRVFAGVTCFTCSNSTSNSACNRVAIDRPCGAGLDTCETVHVMANSTRDTRGSETRGARGSDTRGSGTRVASIASVRVEKRCSSRQQCVLTSGCSWAEDTGTLVCRSVVSGTLLCLCFFPSWRYFQDHNNSFYSATHLYCMNPFLAIFN